jgi:hypothetical protein
LSESLILVLPSGISVALGFSLVKTSISFAALAVRPHAEVVFAL